MKAERIESMTEILETLGVSATNEQIKQIVEDFCLHLEMESEMNSYQHVGYKEPCNKCKKLEYELQTAKSNISVYENSVKSRRNCEEVWIEGDTVKFR